MNKFKKTLQEAGLDYKKEILFLFLSNLFLLSSFVVIFLFLNDLKILIYFLLSIFAFNYFVFSRYKKRKLLCLKNDETEFIRVFSFLMVYLENDYNIYNSFSELIAFCSPVLKERIKTLLQDMDSNKTITPFIAFSNNYENHLIEQTMVSIYQMIDQGSSGVYLLQFNLMFDKLLEENHYDNQEQHFKKMDFINSLPLVGAAMVTIILTLAIVEIIGGMLNGL